MNPTIYKYCMVAQCKSTTEDTPDKLFISVPGNEAMRKKWLTLAKRSDALCLSKRTKIYFCEDHFDLHEDMENYMEYKIMGHVRTRIRMKPGALPSKFNWPASDMPVIVKTEAQVDFETPAVKIPIQTEVQDGVGTSTISTLQKDMPIKIKTEVEVEFETLDASVLPCEPPITIKTEVQDEIETSDVNEMPNNAPFTIVTGPSYTVPDIQKPVAPPYPHMIEEGSETEKAVQVKPTTKDKYNYVKIEIKPHYRSKYVQCQPKTREIATCFRLSTVSVGTMTKKARRKKKPRLSHQTEAKRKVLLSYAMFDSDSDTPTTKTGRKRKASFSVRETRDSDYVPEEMPSEELPAENVMEKSRPKRKRYLTNRYGVSESDTDSSSQYSESDTEEMPSQCSEFDTQAIPSQHGEFDKQAIPSHHSELDTQDMPSQYNDTQMILNKLASVSSTEASYSKRKQKLCIRSEFDDKPNRKLSSTKKLSIKSENMSDSEHVHSKTILSHVKETQMVQHSESEETQANQKKVRRFGRCVCCLKKGLHIVEDIREALECLNVKVCIDTRDPQLVCLKCSEFLQRVRAFRDTVAHSQIQLMEAVEQRGDDGKIKLIMEDEKNVAMSIDSQDMADAATSQEHCVPVDNTDDLTAKTDGKMATTVPKPAKLNKTIRPNQAVLQKNSTIKPSHSAKGEGFDCVSCTLHFKHFNDLRNHVQEKHINESDLRHESEKLSKENSLQVDNCNRVKLVKEDILQVDTGNSSKLVKENTLQRDNSNREKLVKENILQVDIGDSDQLVKENIT